MRMSSVMYSSSKSMYFCRVNVTLGPREDRVLITGLHTVADIHCITCGQVLGWKYEVAFEESQKYKEGKYILEKAKVCKVNSSSNSSMVRHEYTKAIEMERTCKYACIMKIQFACYGLAFKAIHCLGVMRRNYSPSFSFENMIADGGAMVVCHTA